MSDNQSDSDQTKVIFEKCQKIDSNYGIYDVDDHIRQMKPSRELIVYYQNKMKDMQKYSLDIEDQLDRCKKVCEENWYAQDELMQRNDEVSELKKAVSDLQVYLYQEREHVLQLSAENDRLRLTQLEYQKKLDTVLSFAGLPNDFITFISVEPNTVIVPNKRLTASKINAKKNLQNSKSKKELIKGMADSRDDMEKLQVQALVAEWEEQSELYRDEIHSLLLDRDLRQKEWEDERWKLQEQISHLNNMLKCVQLRACDEASRLVNMEKRHEAREAVWTGEKAGLLKDLEAVHQLLHLPSYNAQHVSSQLAALKKQLGQKDELVILYQEQSSSLEEEIERLKETMEKNKMQLKDRNTKTASQVKYFKQKCEEEKRRRMFDAEGFRNDIKFLRDRIQTLERKVFASLTKAQSEAASQIKSTS